MQNLKNDKITAFVSEVNNIKVKVESVMKEKNDEKEKLVTAFTEIEAEANQFISSLKDKLDSLLAVFIKGLGITPEESVGKVKAINILNERIVDEHSFSTIVKRLAFDFESESLFVSYYGSKLYRLNFLDAFNSEMKIKDNNHRHGGICISDGVLYVIDGKTVKKISLQNLQQPLEMCFQTNTDCFHLNGLEIDSKNNRLLHTSEKYEVVCTSFDGSEIFKYKDEFMKKTTSLYVHLTGIIVVGDEDGTIHLISEDGCQPRLIFKSCNKLKNVRDLCFDKSSTRLAIFGAGYIELYDVCAGTGKQS
ncbi:unnamed protein product [Mytilus coruscus]|uniref:Uncharacterized protein n=1 Tax=Mytilus coruscus TaxID=42192 RepID=A0A6J8ES25_MYTCO|nr:unnamed protein product [Mytilus coruscus]